MRRSVVVACFVALLSLVAGALLAADSVNADHVSARASSGNQIYWVEQLASGLNFPLSMVWLPGGDLLITERQGGLRIFRNGRLDPNPISGTPDCFRIGLNGFKEVLLDPDYETNKTLYLLISVGTYEQHHAAVYRARYGALGLTDVERIFRSKDYMDGAHSIAGRMLFLSDKTLLVGVTSSTEGNKALSQQLNSHIGKLVRINRDGSIPPDNPFLKTPGALPEIWSYGHRVQLGLYQDPKTSEIWEIDSGPRGGDELNLLKAGGNFGWARTSWGFAYNNGGLATPLQSDAGIEDPILVWTPSVTPSGFTRYRGGIYPLWDGDYFVGHLTTKELERLRIDGHRVVLQERMLSDLEERIREVKIGPDDHLYILTDQSNGRLLRLQPGWPRRGERSRVAHKIEPLLPPDSSEGDLANLAPGDPDQGKQAFLERCAVCHSVGDVVRGENIGPDLAGVYGRKAGSKGGFNYSAAMARLPQVWDTALLDRFLVDPRRYVPGTSMAAPPVTDPEVRRQIAAFLKQQSGQ